MEEERTYTQAEVDELLQKESDRRVTAALKKREAELSESAKLSAMTEHQKAEYELSKREEELKLREKNLNLNEQKLEAIKVLNSKNLPIELVDFVVSDTAEDTNAKINTISTLFNSAVTDAVKNAIGTTVNTGTTSNGVDKSKMSVMELQRLYNTNPELF